MEVGKCAICDQRWSLALVLQLGRVMLAGEAIRVRQPWMDGDTELCRGVGRSQWRKGWQAAGVIWSQFHG